MITRKCICSSCKEPFVYTCPESAPVRFFCDSCARPLNPLFRANASLSPEGEYAEPYMIRLRRTKNEKIGNSVTFIHLGFGRPRPLSDDSYAEFREVKMRFEIPVFITDNKGKEFEGVLTGFSVGNDVEILWDPDPSKKNLGNIVKSNNASVVFIPRKGATDNW